MKHRKRDRIRPRPVHEPCAGAKMNGQHCAVSSIAVDTHVHGSVGWTSALLTRAQRVRSLRCVQERERAVAGVVSEAGTHVDVQQHPGEARRARRTTRRWCGSASATARRRGGAKSRVAGPTQLSNGTTRTFALECNRTMSLCDLSICPTLEKLMSRDHIERAYRKSETSFLLSPCDVVSPPRGQTEVGA